MEDFADAVEDYLQNLVIEDFLTNSNERPAKREQIILDLTKISEAALINDTPKQEETPFSSVEKTMMVGEFQQKKQHDEQQDIEISNIYYNEGISEDVEEEKEREKAEAATLEAAEKNTLINSKTPYGLKDINNDTILLIVSVGRTGSTTLVNLFNSIPNTNICGENFNAVLRLLHCYYELREIKKAIPTSNNFNIFNLSDVKIQIKNLIISLFKKNKDTDLWGFKEVRWIDNIKMLNVFRDLFPKVKIIFNIRKDTESQSKSAFWKTMNDPQHIIIEQTEITKRFLDENNFNYKTLYLEDFYDNSIMASIYDFLGKSEYYNREDVKFHLDFVKDTYKRQPFLHIHTYYLAKYKFIHIPKTGGSAVEKFIKPYSEHIIGFGHDNICKLNDNPVVVMRYPIDRFLSMFYYWKYGSITPPFVREDGWLKKYKAFTIKDFISLFERGSFKNLYQGFTWDQHFMPASYWLDKDSYSKTTVIIYEKNLQEKVYHMMNHIDIPGGYVKTRINRINISRKDKEEILDERDIEWVRTQYREDFDLWEKLHREPHLFKQVF